jgi:tryptophan-rich sensory protein
MTAAIQIWTISKGGPVLASIYLPLQTILVALMAPIVFGEEFFLGGYVLIIQVTSISICFLIILLMTKYE